MSEEKQKFDVCPECKVRENDGSKKTLYQCLYCKRWFCFKHFDPKLAVFKDFKGAVKDKRLRSIIEEDWKREDGHPDYDYSWDRLREYDVEKEMDRKLIEDILNRSKAHGKRKKRTTKGELSFVKEDDLKRKEQRRKQKRTTRIRRNAKAIAIFLISLIILGIIILSWTNFFAQIFMPRFVDTTQVETDIFKLINQERASRGLPTLLEDEALTTKALHWSEHLAEISNLTHGDFEARIAQIGYSEYQCGEVIAMYGGWSSTLGREFVDMWLGSLGHREIMLTPLSGHMGIGVSKIATTFYAVVDFRFA